MNKIFSHRKIGGIRFFRLHRLRISFCVARPAPAPQPCTVDRPRIRPIHSTRANLRILAGILTRTAAAALMIAFCFASYVALVWLLFAATAPLTQSTIINAISR